MPIYAYRCEACGFAKDVLQKMSDDPLTVCPECQQASFKKQITAAGFQLKGSGWYVTDFRGGSGGTGAAGGATAGSSSSAETSATTSSESTPSNTATSSPSADTKAA
ncbi:zinc ribbon domain-containing protein [Undibacterium sp. LX40W]|uniref:Zinc ribbon domain-containing protein n=1 Tax=Undibacterium nitidum TaxID=2762298 RepID=A0A923HN65_9BURK|nr:MULTISPECIES: FmdB family zinc ribbon protein [Undibacterium]MBC3881458.1 zinc ribbon domain-containing protein [Undibacterium nitidum]MBC3891760.1 zinc ribbon domain-containing protein [Undibacterium sp. LX40W]